MSTSAFSIAAIAIWLTPPAACRVAAYSRAEMASTGRGSRPIRNRSASFWITPVSPWAPYPSIYSDQPTMPSSVVIFRKELTRQPASQCRSSILVIFIGVSSAIGNRIVGLGEAEPVPERVGHNHYSRAPFLVLDRRLVILVWLGGNRAVKSIDPHQLNMDGRTWACVAVMLAQMQREAGARDLHIDGRVIAEAMLPIDGEAEEPAIELLGLLDREDAQDRHGAGDPELIHARLSPPAPVRDMRGTGPGSRSSGSGPAPS